MKPLRPGTFLVTQRCRWRKNKKKTSKQNGGGWRGNSGRPAPAKVVRDFVSSVSFRWPSVGFDFFFGGGGFHRFRDRFLGRSCRNRSRLQRCRMSADRRLPLVQQQLMKIILEENEIFGQKKKFEKWIFFSDASSATAFQRRVSFRGRVVFLVCFPFSFC